MRQWGTALMAAARTRAGRGVRGLIACAGLLGCALVFSGPADIARGIGWLQAQVQVDGSLLGTSNTGSEKQTQCETAITLHRLAGGSSQVAALLGKLTPSSSDATETVACWNHLRQLLGQPASDADLQLRRVGGQGFAAYEGMSVSSALDTGWALVTQLQSLPASDKSTLLSWLQGVQSEAGSFAIAGRADLLATAVIVRGLKDETGRNTAAAQVASKAARWLIAQRLPNGTWADDVALTALVFEAVHPYTAADAAIASSVEAFLLSKQGADGSWQGDAYVSAVALRALALVSTPPVDPAVAANSATVRGVITASGSQQVLAGASVTVSPATGPAQTVVSDSNGQFVLQGVTPGTATLSAAMAGYQAVTTSANLAAGTTAVFSPTLYPTGSSAPAGAIVRGKVVAFGTNASISGATVQLTPLTGAAATVSTDANGGFEAGVSASVTTLSVSASGYASYQQQLILTAGAILNLGALPLQAVRQTSTVRGTVYDFNGQPVAGASVQAIGQAAVATTSSGGGYALAGLSGTAITVQASAAGYVTQTQILTASQPTDLVQDFSLPASGSAYLLLSNLQSSATSVGLRQDVSVTVLVSNSSGLSASSGLAMDVLAPTGQLVATASATDARGNAVPIALADGQSSTAYFKWNSGSFPPGAYQFVVKQFVPGSMTAQNPGGLVTGSLRTAVEVQSSPHFTGSVTVNPPVVPAGAGQPVALAALLQNDGNTPLMAQSYQLAVVDTASGQTVHTETVNADALEVAQLRSLTFASWTPAAGGNFNVQVTASSPASGAISTTLYVGAAGQAKWTVDKTAVPAGTQTVRSTIDVSGQNTVNGVIQDPLAPLVQQALVKAVNYGDNYSFSHYQTLKCYACHVQSQSVAGGERALKYTPPASALARAVLASGITANIFNPSDTSIGVTGPTQDGAAIPYAGWTGGPKLSPSVLGLWGLSQWHEPASVNYTRGRLARYLLTQQGSDGAWSPDDSGTWWSSRAALTALNIESLASVRSELLKQPTSFAGKSLVRVTATGLPSYVWRIATDAAGNLYASGNYGVWKIPAGGGTATRLTTFSASAVVPLPDGRILMGNTSGMFMLQTNGTMTTLGAGWPVSDLTPWPDGTFLMTTPWWDSTPYLYRVTDKGGIWEFASDPVIRGKSGTTAMPDGSVLVTNATSRTMFRFDANGQLDFSMPPPEVVISAAQAQAVSMRPYQGGFLMTTERGLFFYDSNWIAQRWTHEWVYGPAASPDGRVFVNYAGGIYEVKDRPVDAPALSAQVDGSIDSAANWLKAGAGIDANNNVDIAFRLMGLASARSFFQGGARAAEFDSLMQSLGSTLQGRQRSDGGWVWHQGSSSASDPMVTAMVGVALDALNPSPASPTVRNAVLYLLGAQQPDGSWKSPNFSTPQIPSTWVEIWLPRMLDRLGHLDSTLAVTFPPNVTMSNPTQAPATVNTAGDGSTTYQWTFTTGSDAAAQLGFDLTLADMQVDEVRSVAQQANLLFKNSFTDETVSAPIAIPTVGAPTLLSETVRTDKAVYSEAEQATFLATVTNTGGQARTAQVRFTVLDAAGAVVETLPLGAGVDVAANASVVVSAQWPAAGVLAGSYQLKADLLSPAGLSYGSTTTTFSITASQSQAALARLTTDRASYSAAQSVQVTSRVSNSTANTLLENLQAVTEIRSAAGASVLSRTEAIEQLAPGNTRQYGYSLAAANLAAGSYSATVQLRDAGGTVQAQSSASFTLLGADQTGVGLSGQLQVAPAVAIIGQPTRFTLTVANGSSTAFANLPLTIRIVEPVAGALVATLTGSVADLQSGATRAIELSWPAAGADGQVLVAAASIQVGGRDMNLAQANLRLLGVPQLSFSPSEATFAPVYPAEAAGQWVTISSVGTAPVSSLTFTLAGADASQFRLPQSGCTSASSLPVGATCTLAITYQPDAVGSHAGEVRVGFAGAEAAILPLSGQAKPVVFSASVGAGQTEVEAGSSVDISYSVSNPSTATAQFSGALNVQGPAGAVASWSISATVAGGATSAGNQIFAANDVGRFATSLTQQVGSDTRVLATSTFTVIDPPVPVGAATGVKGQARFLVLVSCPPGLGAAADAACVAQRSQAITSYLGALGYAVKTVTSGEAFLAEMRCGSYNTYWISNGAMKLTPQTIGEIRESVRRGEALLMDGVHDSRNRLLHDVAGVKQVGKLPGANQIASLREDGLYGAHALATLGQAERFEQAGGVTHGSFTPSSAQQPAVPAVVSNDWGSGKSLLFAFDLAGMITADVVQADAQLAEFAKVSATHAGSASPTLTIGDITQLAASVTNQGTQTASLKVEAVLPVGLVPLSTSPEVQLTANSDGTVLATWTLQLAGGATQELTWQVKASQSGSFSVPLSIYSVPRAGSTAPPKLRATAAMAAEVMDAAVLLQAAPASIGALQPTASSDGTNKTKAMTAAQAAARLHAQGSYEQAIVQWLSAVDAVASITSVDTTQAKQAIALALEATTDALCIQKCGSAACQ